MRIAVPVSQGRLCVHFGHCEQFVVHDVEPSDRRVVRKEHLTPPPHEPGVLPRWLHEMGVHAIIAGGMGQRALQLFAQQGIEVILGAPEGDPDDLVAAFLSGALKSGANVCDH